MEIDMEEMRRKVKDFLELCEGAKERAEKLIEENEKLKEENKILKNKLEVKQEIER